MREEKYDIGGMHCAACSSAVERVTGKLPGVVSSYVNLPMNRLTISYDEALCSPEQIIKKIEKAGFTAKLHSGEPKAAEAASAARDGLKNEKTQLIISIILAFLLLSVSMGQMLFPNMPVPDIISRLSHPVNFAILQMLLAIPVLFLGKRFFISGFKSLFHGSPNMDTLVAVSSSASFLFSLAMTFLISDDPSRANNLYFESSAVVIALVSVGKYLEAGNKEKTKDAIKKLRKLVPETAILVDENGQWEVPLEMIKPGDTVLVKAGSNVPADGTVTDGSGSINEAMLTGESMPAVKEKGSEVYGGSVSVDGTLFIEVTKTGRDTALSKIIGFVEDAQGKKAPISRTADRVAGVFVPVVFAIALLSAAIWLLCGAEFAFALKIFTCVLVIACPCAMGLATPTAIIVGTGLGASKGILIRSGEALEAAHKTNVVIFDKTGTVTLGTPQITDIVSDNEGRLLTAAASLENLSSHPLAAAVMKEAARRSIKPENVSDFESIAGKGLKATDSRGNVILAGSPDFLRKESVNTENYDERISALEDEGKTVIAVAEGGCIQGIIALADEPKPEASAAVERLRKMGIKTVLLTGDNKKAAGYISRKLGFDETVAEVLPGEKAETVERYRKSGAAVMMAGDGINDAPALVQADIGCAVGSGSDIAIDAADIVLMRSDINDVCRCIALSRETIKTIRQNLFWAFCYNTLAIPIAAGALYPAFGILLSPMIGGLAMSLSSLFVVTNALRLKRRSF